MDFREYLKNSQGQIEQELANFYETSLKEAKEVSELLVPLIKATIEASTGGKRLRGTLVKLGFELAGNPFNKNILKPAVAFEIFQTAILAHDDIIDKSPLRRGRPTIYKALGGDHYGLSQAICLADLGFFQAIEMISESGFPEKSKNLGVSSFAKTMEETTIGEILDIEIPHSGQEKKESDALVIFKLKTARYTITGPLLLGAILGGGDQELIKAIEEFGLNLGIAYQIQDDILGVFSTEQEIGKPNTSDIEEGKLTILITQALSKATSSQKEFLEKKYGCPNLDSETLEEIKNIFTSTGALDYCRTLALEYVERAKKFIPVITQKKDYQSLLEQMANFLIERNK